METFVVVWRDQEYGNDIIVYAGNNKELADRRCVAAKREFWIAYLEVWVNGVRASSKIMD